MGLDEVAPYLAKLPPSSRALLEQVRTALLVGIPEGEDGMAYQMPVIRVRGRSMVHYAAWKSHLSIYPAPDDPALQDELRPYVAGKGTLHFSYDRPLPTELVTRIAVALRAEGTKTRLS
jgi:uncharacterized protein YdhG (YjbR/CyaY superfamily)